ncbi:MAG: iron-sulfur cluster assembly scaffold protein [Candidatus Diapherotrites archaeon]|nr:iron-sulfur cluster assembly scaffold protein [Candidatus Diapherotrites archaeon]
MDEYNDKVINIFKNPHNMGEIKDADGIGKVGNPMCGDIIYAYIKIKDNVIEDVKVKTFGCVAAIVTSSTMTDLVKGKTIEEALKITKQDIADELGGLPQEKMHCSNLANDALRNAVEDYQKKKKSN